MNLRTTIAAAVVAALALGVSACGGGDDDSQGETVEEAAQNFVTALNERDFATACSYFAEEELEERMGGEEQCEKSLDVTTPEDPLPGFEITGTHEGEEGSTVVQFKTEDGKSNEFQFIQEDQIPEEKPAAESEESEEGESEEGEGQGSDQRGEWVFFED